MKHISETNLMKSTPEPEKPQDLTRAMKVWAQLAEMFSKAFYRENGEVPPALWRQAIWRLTDAQIATGLANLGNDGHKFPPNLSMFIAACKRSKPIRQLGVRYLPLSKTQVEKNADLAWDYMEKLAGRKLRPHD